MSADRWLPIVLAAAPAPHPPNPMAMAWMLAFGFLFFAAGAAVWSSMIAHWRRGSPVVRYEPRRRVPWRGIDVALIFLFYVVLREVMIQVAPLVLGAEALKPPDVGLEAPIHPVAKLLQSNNVWVTLACVFSAVLVAPLAEEFLFRVMLQGWLESVAARWRRRLDLPGMARAVLPIGTASLLFAAPHFRIAAPPMTEAVLVYVVVGMAVINLITTGFAVVLVGLRTGATAADLGWVPKKLGPDVERGLLAFLAFGPVIYLMQLLLHFVLPKELAPDPFAIFVLALILGTLYWRTHRLAPSVAVHMALNATSLTLAWLNLGG